MAFFINLLEGPGPPIDLRPNPEAIKPQRLEEHDQHHDQAIEDELDVGDPVMEK